MMLYGLSSAQEAKTVKAAKSSEPVISVGKTKNAKAPAAMVVGDLRQSLGIVSQKASSDVVGAMPGGATQNHLINQGVASVMRRMGSMNVPGL